MNKTSEERHIELKRRFIKHDELLRDNLTFILNDGKVSSIEYKEKQKFIKAEWKFIKEEMKALKIKPMSLNSLLPNWSVVNTIA